LHVKHLPADGVRVVRPVPSPRQVAQASLQSTHAVPASFTYWWMPHTVTVAVRVLGAPKPLSMLQDTVCTTAVDADVNEKAVDTPTGWGPRESDVVTGDPLSTGNATATPAAFVTVQSMVSGPPPEADTEPVMVPLESARTKVGVRERVTGPTGAHASPNVSLPVLY
jgi:hypothetical protein